MEIRTSFADEGKQVQDVDGAAGGDAILKGRSCVSGDMSWLVVSGGFTDECASVASGVASITTTRGDGGGNPSSGGRGRGLYQSLSVIPQVYPVAMARGCHSWTIHSRERRYQNYIVGW